MPDKYMQNLSNDKKEGDQRDTYFVDSTARVLGEVTIGPKSSLWPGTIVEGEDSDVRIGEGTVILNSALLKGTESHPVEVGDGVLISPGSHLEGCEIKDGALVGIDSIVLEGAEIGENSILGTNTLVKKDMKIPDNSIVRGQPAEVVGEVTEEELEQIKEIRSHVKWKSEEHKMMLERGKEYDVYQKPKRPEEIVEQRDDLDSEDLGDILDLEKIEERLSRDLRD